MRDKKGKFIKDEDDEKFMQLAEGSPYKFLGLGGLLTYAKNLIFAFLAFLLFSLITPFLKERMNQTISEQYCKLPEIPPTSNFKPK